MEILETSPIAESVPPNPGAGAERIIEPTAPLSSGPAADLKPDRAIQAEAARSRAKQFMADGQFTEARKALEEADTLEKDPKLSPAAASKARLNRFVTGVKSRMRKDAEAEARIETEEQRDADASALAVSAVNRALEIVSLYSKIAAGVGLLPTFVLNFAGVLAVQITMVWKIAGAFHQTRGKEKIRGSILSLIGSVLPGSVGHGIGLAVAAIPAVVTGTLLSFVLAPALAYAMTKAVGNVFIMHFESGGTLLSFDPEQFREHFAKEFRNASGVAQAA